MLQPRRTASVALLAAIGVGCASTAPTPFPTSVIHFRNLVDNALFIQVGTPDTGSSAVLKPCGGEATLVAPVPPDDDPRVVMAALYDTTGFLDDRVRTEGDVDAAELNDRFWPGGAMIWSRGDIPIEDLPVWVTFRPHGTDVTPAAPADTRPGICATFEPVAD